MNRQCLSQKRFRNMIKSKKETTENTKFIFILVFSFSSICPSQPRRKIKLPAYVEHSSRGERERHRVPYRMSRTVDTHTPTKPPLLRVSGIPFPKTKTKTNMNKEPGLDTMQNHLNVKLSGGWGRRQKTETPIPL